MAPNEPRDHHYVPKFYLRNFAVDEAKARITTVGKGGSVAVWMERSIDGLGYERDFYVHMRRGVPVSVETDINRRIETPISRSDTWAKIASGKSEELDRSDRAILYALMRHLEVRTPHYEATLNELATMAGDPGSTMPFSDDERAIYSAARADPNLTKTTLNAMASSTAWTERSFEGAAMTILRSPIALRTSTVPVLALRVRPHPAIYLPQPGMVPYQLVLPLNPTTIACLVLGDFGGAFSNQPMNEAAAAWFNLNYVGQFSFFDHVRHLITAPHGLVEDMTWAPYQLLEKSERRMVFKRKTEVDAGGLSH